MYTRILYSNQDLPPTTPFPPKPYSFLIRIIEGDLLEPLGIGLNWFTPPYPKHILHLRLNKTLTWLLQVLSILIPLISLFTLPLPITLILFLLTLFTPGRYIAWRFKDKAGYIGSKIYGVDAPPYKFWLCDPKEVYDGSTAYCLSIRPFATLQQHQKAENIA